MNKVAAHPGKVNSSLICFATAFLALISFGMAGQFSAWNRTAATIAIFLTGLLFTAAMLWWLPLFESADELYTYFTLTFIIAPTVGGLVLNHLIGPLHEGQVPIIAGVGVFIQGVAQVSALPSVLIHYGGFAFVCSMGLAIAMELIYVKLLLPRLPRRVKSKLASVDSVTDSKAVELSDEWFFVTNKGLLLGTLGVLFTYILVYGIIYLGSMNRQ